MEGRKVRCRTCGGVFYETTEKYDPDKPLTGDMLRLCYPYCTYQWPTYDGLVAVNSTSRFLMFCCSCAGLVSTTGKLHFVDEPSPDESLTPVQEEAVAKIEKEATSSKLTLTQEQGSEQFICKECGKVCKSKAGLLAHLRISASRKEE